MGSETYSTVFDGSKELRSSGKLPQGFFLLSCNGCSLGTIKRSSPTWGFGCCSWMASRHFTSLTLRSETTHFPQGIVSIVALRR